MGRGRRRTVAMSSTSAIDFTNDRHGDQMIIGSKTPTDERRSRIKIVPEDRDRINAIVGEVIARGAIGTGTAVEGP
jgi:hypothetical protein